MRISYRHCFYCVHEPRWEYSRQRKNHGHCKKRGWLSVDTGHVTTEYGTPIEYDCSHFKLRPPSPCAEKARIKRGGKNIWESNGQKK